MSINRERKKAVFSTFSQSIGSLLSTSALTAAGLIAASVAGVAHANDAPWTGFSTEHGSATFDASVAGKTNITQHTDRYVGTSGNLDIPENYHVNIDQLSSASLFAAKAAPDADPTKVLGQLSADGKVVIIDNNGVFFGENSRVDVAGLIATTGNITNDQLVYGTFGQYTIDEVKGGRIDLHGVINVTEAGLAAFVAPTVANSGIINARVGKVAFASGEKVTLDLYGDRLVEIAVEGDAAETLIENTGTINAEGGVVQMSALAAKDAVDNIVNVDGVVTVASAEVKGGKIILSGGKAGVVKVAGKVDASGATDGGTVDVTGQNIHVTDTADVSADGGKGSGGTGDGGDVRFYADNAVIFEGEVSARGGAFGGDGGDAEVSGVNYIGYRGVTDLTAANGRVGSLLLDPTNVDIVAGVAGVIGAGNVFDPSALGVVTTTLGWDTIVAALGLADVTVTTTGGAPTAGEISVLASRTYDSAHALNLLAHRVVRIGDGVEVVNTGTGDMTFLAGWNGDLVAPSFAQNPASFSFVSIGQNARVETGGDVNILAEESFAINSGAYLGAQNINIVTDALIGHSPVIPTISAVDTVSIERNTTGEIHLGTSSSYMNISQAELAGIHAQTLSIGGASTTEIVVNGADSTTSTISGTVDLKALGAGGDITFSGDNTFNALSATANDDITVSGGASVNTKTGGVSLVANNSVADGTDVLQVDGTIDTTLAGASGTVNLQSTGYFTEIGATGSVKTDGGQLAVTSDHGFDTEAGAMIDLGAGNAHIDTPDVNLGAGIDTTGTITGTATDVTVENDAVEIQDGVDIVVAGGTLNIDAGTYAQSTTLDKALNVQGAGVGTTIISAPTGDGFHLAGNQGAGNTTTIDGITFDGNAESGVDVDSATVLGELAITNSAFNNNGIAGVSVGGDSNQTNLGHLNVQDSTFLDNGSPGQSDGDGDIFAFRHNGDVTIKNVTIENNATGGNPADYGIQIRGHRDGTGAVSASGNLVFDNVKVAGAYRAAQLGIQEFDGVSFSLKDVVLGGQTTALTPSNGWGALYFSNIGAGSYSLGNTSFGQRASLFYQDIINDSIADFDASGVSFNGILGATATTAQSFLIEDGVYHALDPMSKSGLVTWKAGEVFVTQFSGSIQRGIDAATAGDIVNVSRGQFFETATVNKSVDLRGANAGISAKDGVRVTETEVSTVGPGNTFTVTADDVIIDGFSISGGTHSVDVQGADNTVIQNNIMTGTAGASVQATGATSLEVMYNRILSAGTDGVNVVGGQDVTVGFNLIDTPTGSGVVIDGTTNAAASNNMIMSAGVDGVKITGAGGLLSADRNMIDGTGGYGIIIDQNADSVKANTIDNTGNDGIEITKGTSGMFVNANRVGTLGLDGSIAGEGIDVNNTEGVNVLLNMVSNTTGHGISLNPSSSTFITLNTVDHVDGDAINVLGGIKNTIDQNIIGQAGAGSIGGEGINADRSDAITIVSNTVGNTGSHGISLDNTTIIDPTGKVSTTNHNLINSNHIDNVGGDGIIVTGSARNTVSNNFIGQASGPGSIAGNGVRFLRSNGIVKGNFVDYTLKYGIDISSSHGMQILSNTVGALGSAAVDSIDGHDGIMLWNSGGAWIEGNNVSHTGCNGIAWNYSEKVTAHDNTVYDVLLDGITSWHSNNSVITANTINETSNFGIKSETSEGIRIADNLIGLLGGSDTITTTGVWVNASGKAMVENNQISNTGLHGAFVDGSSFATLHNNTVRDTGGHGLAANASGNVKVTSNNISGAGENGIDVAGSDDATIESNRIFARVNIGGPTTHGANNHGINVSGGARGVINLNTIQGEAVGGFGRGPRSRFGALQDGIHVEGNEGVKVTNNIIEDDLAFFGRFVRIARSVGNDGIFVGGSEGAFVDFNTVDRAGGDGVHVSGSHNAVLTNNMIDDSGENGMRVDSSNRVEVAINTIEDSRFDGIQVNNGRRLNAHHNTITDSGDDGIDVNGNALARVFMNGIDDVRSDGIEISDSNWARVRLNTINNTGDDGIDAEGGRNILIGLNTITNTGSNPFASGNGIEASGLVNSVIARNNVSLTGVGFFSVGDGINVTGGSGLFLLANTVTSPDGDGIQLSGVGSGLLAGNTLTGSRDEGIDIDGSSNLTLVRNTVTGGRDDGIEVDGSSNITMRGNTSSDNAFDGIDIDGVTGALITGNTTNGNGDNGIEARRSNGAVITANTANENDGDGINLGSSSGLLVSLNTANGNDDDGISANGTNASTISGNTANENGDNGIQISDITRSITVSANTANENGGAGVSVDDSFGVTVTGNGLTGNDIGVQFVDTTSSGAIGNVVSNSITTGISLENVDMLRVIANLITNSGAQGLFVTGTDNGLITVSGNTFVDNPVGALFENGEIDISDLTLPNNFINTGAVTTTPVGMQFNQTGRPGTLTLTGNTLGATLFTGFTGAGSFYVRLEDGSFLDPLTGDPVLLNGLQANFDGIVPISTGGILSEADLGFIEERLFDADDIVADGRGQIFVGDTLSGLTNIEDFFNQFGAVAAVPGGLSVTITGLPFVTAGGPTPAALNLIAPAAGEGTSAEDVAGIEPAAGEGSQDAACWGDAVNAAQGGTAVTYSFGGAFSTESLVDAANCGAQSF